MSKWYIVRAATRQEAKAVRSLREAKFEAYCPMLTRWSRLGRRGDRWARVQSALFPGYLFVQIGDGQFATVEAADGVHAVLRYTTTSGDRSPRKAPDGLVETIQQADDEGKFDNTLTPQEEAGFAVGRQVKVTVGAWWGHVATIIKLDAKGRIAVLHTLFGRTSEANYDPKHLELVA